MPDALSLPEPLAASLARLRGRAPANRYPCVWPLPVTPDLAETLFAIPPSTERVAVVERLEMELAEAQAARAARSEPEASPSQVASSLRAALAALDGLGFSQSPERRQLQARLEAAESGLTVHPSVPDDPYVLDMVKTDVDRIAWQLEDARAALRQAQARDALLEARPAGCWCFGTGGRGRRWLAKDDATLAGQPWLFDQYCPCPEGTARAQADADTRAVLVRHRQDKLVSEVLGNSGVPPHFRGCLLTTFPVTARSRASYAEVLAWWEAIREGRRVPPILLLHGLANIGKTGMASGLFNAWVELDHARPRPPVDLVAIAQGRSVAAKPAPPSPLFLKVGLFLESIKSTFDKPGVSAMDLLQLVETAPFVVLDDFGTQQPTPWSAAKLFEIIDGRHDSGLLTVITSNLSPAKMELFLSGLGDSDMALVEAHMRDPEKYYLPTSIELAWHRGQRLVWRVVEVGKIVEFKGDNLRDPQVRADLGLTLEEPA